MQAASPVQSSKPRMSVAELEARAQQRAHAERVHIFRVPGRPGVYTTKSKSNPAERYTLVAKNGVAACACRGYYYRQSCKHQQALLNRLGREARTPGPRGTAAPTGHGGPGTAAPAASVSLLYAEVA